MLTYDGDDEDLIKSDNFKYGNKEGDAEGEIEMGKVANDPDADKKETEDFSKKVEEKVEEPVEEKTE